jgi:hypothetical protein
MLGLPEQNQFDASQNIAAHQKVTRIIWDGTINKKRKDDGLAPELKR